jgi:single-strand DNA-binding protein
MNVITLVGRLTADPDRRTVQAAGAERTVTTLGLAVPSDRDADPLYVDITVWGAPAEACATWLRRGRRVAVTGRLDQTRWTGPDGAPRRAHRIVASRVDFLDGPRAGDAHTETGSEAPTPSEAVEAVR